MPTIDDSLREQGMQQGILQDSKEAVIYAHEVRFEIVPESIIKTVNEIRDPPLLRILLRKAVKLKTIVSLKFVIGSIGDFGIEKLFIVY